MTRQAMKALVRDAAQVDWGGLDLAAGLRVAVCVTVPVSLGLWTGHDLDGMIAALGSLNVAVAEGVGRYSSRALTLVSVLIGNAVSVGIGTVIAPTGWWGVPILLGWVLAAAYVGVIGPIAERTGWFAALMFMIGLGLPHPSAIHAGRYAALVAVGGMWAVAVITALWPMHPHRPVMRSVGRAVAAVADLLQLIGQAAPAAEIDAAVFRAEALGHEAGAMTRWRLVHDRGYRPVLERLRQLAIASEEARTAAIVIDQRLRQQALPGHEAATVRLIAERLGREIAAAGIALRSSRNSAVVQADHTATDSAVSPPGDDAVAAALAHLATAAAGLAGHRDEDQFADHVDLEPSTDTSAARTFDRARTALGANLNRSSFWLRYAVRFAAAAAAGLVIERALGLDKGYWVLITIAVVVKPELSLSTTSTVHRVMGTLLGALLGAVLIIAVPSSWGLVATLFLLSVVAISLIRVNYGLAVVFITPLVLVLLNVPRPGQWQLADIRLVNTLLGAVIGLVATTAILTGSERGLLVDRGRMALSRDAAYLRSIGRDTTAGRLAARRAARTTIDDLFAIVNRVMAEPISLGGQCLNAAAGLGDAASQLWERETELALTVPPEQMTAALRQGIDAAAAHLNEKTGFHASFQPAAPPEPSRAPVQAPPSGPVLDSLSAINEAVLAAVSHLERVVKDVGGRDRPPGWP